MTANLRSALRESTTASHRRLDSVVGSIESFSSLERYAIYLTVMQQLHVRFTSALDRSSELAGLPLASPGILERLASDLASLPATPPALLGLLTTTDANAGDGSDDAWAIGVGYTLEGSAMGAQGLVKSAEDTLPAGTPTGFLALMSEGASARWPTYAKHLKTSNADTATATAGATAVFDTAFHLFDQAAKHLSHP